MQCGEVHFASKTYAQKSQNLENGCKFIAAMWKIALGQIRNTHCFYNLMYYIMCSIISYGYWASGDLRET